MKNTSSLLLTLVSYLIMLATILFLMFAVIPPSLKAQTNAEMVATNAAVTNAIAALTTTNPPVAASNHVKNNPAAQNENSSGHHEDLGFGTTLVGIMPFVVGIMPFIFPVAIIAVIFFFKHRRNKLAHETLRIMIEKGAPVTPEVIAALRGKDGQDKNGSPTGGKTGLLLAGLILAGVGIGVIAVAGKPGLIVLFIGVAFLVVWLVERKNNNDAQPPKT
jgi:hypothetical protein